MLTVIPSLDTHSHRCIWCHTEGSTYQSQHRQHTMHNVCGLTHATREFDFRRAPPSTHETNRLRRAIWPEACMLPFPCTWARHVCRPSLRVGVTAVARLQVPVQLTRRSGLHLLRTRCVALRFLAKRSGPRPRVEREPGLCMCVCLATSVLECLEALATSVLECLEACGVE